MDLLAAVLLCNQIGHTWNIKNPLANILQGISIKYIVNQAYEKLINGSSSRNSTEHNSSDAGTIGAIS